MEHYNYEKICKYLYDLIPKEEWERLEYTLGEMCPEFLGFCDTYYHLSRIIPKDWTVIDFGAANNPQSYFFTKHNKYIAVNPPSDIEEENSMFCPSNCEIYRMTTGEFLKNVDYPKEKVFAICNYVPNWYGEDSRALVRKNFKNCYTFTLNRRRLIMRKCRVVIDNNIFGSTFYVVQEKIFGLWWNKKGFKDAGMLESYILELEEKGYLVTIKDKRDEN